MTVYGNNLDSVAEPLITVTVEVTSNINTTSSTHNSDSEVN